MACWFNGRVLDLQSRSHRFDSWLGLYQVHTGKPSRYITNTKVNTAIHLFGAVSRVLASLPGDKVSE